MRDNFNEELNVGDQVVYYDHYAGICYGVISRFTRFLVFIDRHRQDGSILPEYSRKRPEDLIKVRHK